MDFNDVTTMDVYRECVRQILDGLEIPERVEEYESWIETLHQKPNILNDLFREYSPRKGK